MKLSRRFIQSKTKNETIVQKLRNFNNLIAMIVHTEIRLQKENYRIQEKKIPYKRND